MKPSELTYDSLNQLMANHSLPNLSVTLQHFWFNCHTQRPEESVAKFVTQMKRLGEHCEGDAVRPTGVQVIEYEYSTETVGGGGPNPPQGPRQSEGHGGCRAEHENATSETNSTARGRARYPQRVAEKEDLPEHAG